ncbi:MAG: DUF3375 family protein [Planctomycetales bacterium]|nr:DUF3375 family protein [Planctomycetales bacterium]
MQVATLQRFFAHAPAMRLLRSPHATWIIPFLHQQFKASQRSTRQHSELTAALANHLQQLPPSESRSQSPADAGTGQADKAGAYLSNWCSAGTGWLTRFFDEQQPEACYQLTADTELVLSFVQRATAAPDVIGTQSRLRAILGLLQGVAEGSSSDPRQRMQQLQRQRAEIDRQLAQLAADPQLACMPASEAREQFALAAGQLEQLKSEFRAVEDRFKAITREVQQKVLSGEESRGGILSFALDAEDLLKSGEQGKSFFEFLKLLHAPRSQERIAEVVEQLTKLESLAAQHTELDAIRGMVPALLAEAEKILRTTQHLSATLRRVLDARSTRQHRQLAHLLRDIVALASRRAAHPPTEIGLDIEVELEIQSPFDHPFWTRPEPFEEVMLQPAEVDSAAQELALQQLTELHRIDWQTMRHNVTLATRSQGETTITQLLEQFPLQAGAIELLGYLQIAHDDGHRIDGGQRVEASWVGEGLERRRFRLPQVVFLPDAARRIPPREHSDRLPIAPVPGASASKSSEIRS